jgi:hypothetical protein
MKSLLLRFILVRTSKELFHGNPDMTLSFSTLCCLKVHGKAKTSGCDLLCSPSCQATHSHKEFDSFLLMLIHCVYLLLLLTCREKTSFRSPFSQNHSLCSVILSIFFTSLDLFCIKKYQLWGNVVIFSLLGWE